MDQSTYQPLYLKHRPQALGDLVGQKSVVQTLTNAIENNRIAHAYLFTGPRGTGKTSSARILAKSLNCQKGPTVTPCLECASCTSIKDSSCPSVFEIDAASNNSVDDARTLIERAPLVAQGGRNKLYIIDECHMLTKEAFNALLKTIEEPPPNVIFVLATTEEHKVPPTILSRCQRLMFRLVQHDDLSEHLSAVAKKENIEIEKEALELITRRSGGGLRDALGLLDQASLLAKPGEPVTQKDLLVLLGALDEDVLLTLSKGIMERNGKAVLDAVNGLLMQGREPALIAQEMAKHFLALAKASYVAEQGKSSQIDTSRFILGSQTYIEGLLAQSQGFERVELTQMVEELDRLEQALKRSTQPSMTLEISLLSLCHRHDIASVKQLSERIDQLEGMIGSGQIPNTGKRPAQDSPPPYRPHQAPPPAPVETRPPVEKPSPAAPERPPVESRPATEPAPPAPPEQKPSPGSSSSDSPTAAVQGEEPPYAKAVEISIPKIATTPEDIPSDDHDSEEVDSYEEREQINSVMLHTETPTVSQESKPTAQSSFQTENIATQQPVEAQSRGAGSQPESDGTYSQVALEELWSDLLDALHKRSIPAYSLVSMHAFPVRFESMSLTIGVQKEFFQKSIENKTNNIIQAYKDLKGDEIRVIVKVMTDAAPLKAAPRPAPQNAEPRMNQPPPPSSYDAGSHTDEPPARTEPRHEAPNRIDEDEGSYDDDEESEPQAKSEVSTTAAQIAPAAKIEQPKLEEPKTSNGTSEPRIAGEELDSSKVQEAYKIFEGPGSRLIG